jgi:hypothetical protein
LSGISSTSLANAASVLLGRTLAIKLVGIIVSRISVGAARAMAGLEEVGRRIGTPAMGILAGSLAVGILAHG